MLILVGLFHNAQVESSHTALIVWIIGFDSLIMEKMSSNKFLFTLQKNSVINYSKYDSLGCVVPHRNRIGWE